MTSRDTNHPLFEQAQIARAQHNFLVDVAVRIERDGPTLLCMSATACSLVQARLRDEIHTKDKEARSTAWRHFLYLTGETVE